MILANDKHIVISTDEYRIEACANNGGYRLYVYLVIDFGMIFNEIKNARP
jgi:hypothetical protein